MQKVVQLVLNYCNARCPYHFHNYEDGDNIWCGHPKLNKKILDADDSMVMFDFSSRKIPDECPLEDVE